MRLFVCGLHLIKDCPTGKKIHTVQHYDIGPFNDRRILRESQMYIMTLAILSSLWDRLSLNGILHYSHYAFCSVSSWSWQSWHLFDPPIGLVKYLEWGLRQSPLVWELEIRIESLARSCLGRCFQWNSEDASYEISYVFLHAFMLSFEYWGALPWSWSRFFSTFGQLSALCVQLIAPYSTKSCPPGRGRAQLRSCWFGVLFPTSPEMAAGCPELKRHWLNQLVASSDLYTATWG